MIVGALILTIISCSNVDSSARTKKQSNGVSFEIINIEGHEYIWLKPRATSYEGGLAHNENCNNPVHKN